MNQSVCPELDLSIVTHQSLKWLPVFFDSLRAQDFPLSTVHLHLRDNGSMDGTPEWLEQQLPVLRQHYASVTLQRGANVGFGQGHNANLAECRSNYLLVTNVDLTFETHTLTELLATAQADDPRVVAWECRQKPYEHPKHYHPAHGDTLWVSGACVMFRADALRRVGGFEPRLFLYGEDVELSYRLRDQGWRLRYVPRACVWHYTYESAGQIKPAQFLGSTLANALIRCRFGTPLEALNAFALTLSLLLLPQNFPRQRWGLVRNFFKLCVLAPFFLATRKRSQASFPFRGLDYEFIRDGAFHAAAALPADRSALPLVSVLVRTMPGRQGWLAESIQSVVNQSYPRIQLVVVEDGGHTAATRLAELEASGRLECVTYVPLDNMGRCAAGNRALALAQGEYCCFLDDDDLLYGDHIEILVQALYQSPQWGGVYAWAFQVETRVHGLDPLHYEEKLHQVIHRQPFERAILWHHNFMPIQAVLFRRSLYQQYGGLDTELDNLEDWNLWIRYTQEHPFGWVPKVTSLYRVPADPMIARGRQQALDNYYAKAQAKNAQVKLTLSPPEVVRMAEVLGRDLYLVTIPRATWRRKVLFLPGIGRIYPLLFRLAARWRLHRTG